MTQDLLAALQRVDQLMDPQLLYKITLEYFPEVCYPDGTMSAAQLAERRASVRRSLESGELKLAWDRLVHAFYTEIQVSVASGLDEKTAKSRAWRNLTEGWYKSRIGPNGKTINTSTLSLYRNQIYTALALPQAVKEQQFSPKVLFYDPFYVGTVDGKRVDEYEVVLKMLAQYVADFLNNSYPDRDRLRAAAKKPGGFTAEDIISVWKDETLKIDNYIRTYATVLKTFYVYPAYEFDPELPVFSIEPLVTMLLESWETGRRLFLGDMADFLGRFGIVEATAQKLAGGLAEPLDGIFDAFLVNQAQIAGLFLGPEEQERYIAEVHAELSRLRMYGRSKGPIQYEMPPGGWRWMATVYYDDGSSEIIDWVTSHENLEDRQHFINEAIQIGNLKQERTINLEVAPGLVFKIPDTRPRRVIRVDLPTNPTNFSEAKRNFRTWDEIFAGVGSNCWEKTSEAERMRCLSSHQSQVIHQLFEQLAGLRQWAGKKLEEYTTASGGFSVTDQTEEAIRSIMLSQTDAMKKGYLELFKQINPGQSVAMTALLGTFYLLGLYGSLSELGSQIGLLSGRELIGGQLRNIQAEIALRGQPVRPPTGVGLVLPENLSISMELEAKSAFEAVKEQFIKSLEQQYQAPWAAHLIHVRLPVPADEWVASSIRAGHRVPMSDFTAARIDILMGTPAGQTTPASVWIPALYGLLRSAMPVALSAVVGRIVSSTLGATLFGYFLVLTILSCTEIKEMLKGKELTQTALKHIDSFIEEAKRKTYPSYGAFLAEAMTAIRAVDAEMSVRTTTSSKVPISEIGNIHIPQLRASTGAQSPYSIQSAPGYEIKIDPYRIDLVLSAFNESLIVRKLTGQLITYFSTKTTTKKQRTTSWSDRDLEALARMTYAHILGKLRAYLEQFNGKFVPHSQIDLWITEAWSDVFNERALLYTALSLMQYEGPQSIFEDPALREEIENDRLKASLGDDTYYLRQPPISIIKLDPQKYQPLVTDALRRQATEMARVAAIYFVDRIKAAYPVPNVARTTNELVEILTADLRQRSISYGMDSALRARLERELESLGLQKREHWLDTNKTIAEVQTILDAFKQQCLSYVSSDSFVDQFISEAFLTKDKNGNIVLSQDWYENLPWKWQLLFQRVEAALTPLANLWIDARNKYLEGR